MGTLYGVDGDLLERQYRNHLSNYLHWDQLAHAENWLLFEKNIGAYVCIDEVALSRGELYTVLINKETYGGSIIGIIKGTDVCTVTSVLLKLSRRRRYQVREITLDMAPNMEQIARTCFPAAKRVTDRFHVQKLAYEAVQEMRVKARWEALDEESIQIAYAKACGKMYHAPVFANGDTRKQLLARSIYLLYKKESLWTQSQRIRAEILFKEYPDIKKGYYMAQQREATDRPLLPAEHNALKQLVTKLAAATGEPSKQIWQSMLELSGVKDGELIPAKLFNHLVTWLQARQTLSQQNTPTLESLQMTLKQPLDASELAALSAYIQQKYGLSAQSSLSSAQAEDILNQLYQRRVKGIDPRVMQPLLNPFPPMMDTLQNMATRPALWILLVAIILMLVWLVR